MTLKSGRGAMPHAAMPHSGARLFMLLVAGLAALLALASVAALTLAFLKQFIHPGLFFNSDALYLPAVYADLVERGGRLSQWFLTPAPYFFPDWPVYFTLAWLSSSMYAALAGYMTVQALAMWLLAASIARRFSSWPQALIGATLATVLTCRLAADIVYPYNFIMLPTYHFSAWLALLAALALLLPVLQRQAAAPRGTALALALLTALMVLSDRIFALQFAAPALIMLAASRRTQPGWRWLAGAIAAGCVAGVLLYKWPLLVANGLPMPWHLSRGALRANLGTVGAMIAAVWRYNAALVVCSALFYAGLLMVAPGALRRLLGKRGVDGGADTAGWLALFSLTSVLLSGAAIVLSSDLPTERYFLPLFLIPLVLGPALLHGYWRADGMRAGLVGAALLLAAAVPAWQLVQLALQAGPVRADYYPQEVACLDRLFEQYDLRHGAAMYWDAKRVAMLSRRRPTIATYTPQLQRQHWINTDATFMPAYDFVLLSGEGGPEQIDEARLRALNGPPAAVGLCAPVKLLIYPRGGLKAGFLP